MVSATTEGDGVRLSVFKEELSLQCDCGVGIGGSVWTSGLLLLDFFERNETEMRRKFAGNALNGSLSSHFSLNPPDSLLDLSLKASELLISAPVRAWWG